jgi:hypothetical protein
MFGNSKQKEKSAQERMDEYAEVAADLEAKAKAAEPAAMSERDKRLEDCKNEWKRDNESFVFECRRWGDFLTLMVKRLSLESWRDGGASLASYVSAINIRETREIRLDLGSPADDAGELGYTVFMESDDGKGSGWGTGCGHARAPKGYHYVVRPNFPYSPHRPMVTLDAPERDHGNYIMSDQNRLVHHKTRPYPRYAVDDRIRFNGPGATLFCPHGRGQEIQKVILTEIGDFMHRVG